MVCGLSRVRVGVLSVRTDRALRGEADVGGPGAVSCVAILGHA